PLDQLDEGRLARARMADKAEALAAGYGDVEALVKRRRVAGIAEGDGLEPDRTRLDADRRGVGAVGNAQRLLMQPRQLLHLVDGALKLVHLLADIAQIAVNDEIARQH